MKTEAEAQLAKLVSMPTISHDVTANELALDYVESYLAARGMYCKQYLFDEHPVLAASTRADNLLTPKVLLTAHSDVVAGDEERFTLTRKDDTFYGRGTYDMKFAIAGYMQVVDDLKESLEDYDFGIVITSDEELGSQATYRMIESGLRPQICIMPDSTAPGWDIETVAKGFWRFELTAQGRTAHGARPWEGESASFKLIQALHELKGHFEGHNVKSDSLNIGKIQGGQAYNVVPSEMVAKVEIRFLNEDSLKEKQKIIKELCKKYGLRFEEFVLCPAVLTDLTHPLVEEYLDSVEEVVGRRPQPFISCAGSDAPPYFEAGINCILSCPSGGGHHTEDEWLSRSEFLRFVPILHNYLEKTARSTQPVAAPVAKKAAVAKTIAA